jgi:predicted DCC family thiol-disulfide oxidoreductase YuxK
MGPSMGAPIVFFDGVCNLCNGAVNFLLDRDRRGRLRFAPLQGSTYASLQSAHPDLSGVDSIVLADDEGVHVRSTAALRLLRHLGAPWSLLSRMGLIVPRRLRDWLYDRVARGRYRWFGRQEACRVPTPALRARFLD